MKLVKLAVIVAATLLLISPVLSDTVVGSGQIDQTNDAPEQPIGRVGKIEFPPTPPTVRSPSRPLPRWQTREGMEMATKRVLRGDFALRNHTHKSIKGRRINYKKIYREVDARDRSVFSRAKRYTDEQIKKHLKVKGVVTPKPNTIPLDPSKLSPAIYSFSSVGGTGNGLWFLAIAGIVYVIWHWGYPYWLKRKRTAEPEPAPEPDMTNTDNGDYFGYDDGPARVALTCDGTTVIKKWKGWADCSLSDGSFDEWAASDQTIEGKFKVGARLSFALCRENIGNVPISTDGVIIVDDFHSNKFGRFVPGSGRLVVSNQKVADLDDEFIQRIRSGAKVKLGELIDEIPANSSVHIVYDVICLPTTGKGVGPADAPTPNGEPKREPRFKLADILAGEAEPEPDVKDPEPAPVVAKPAEPEVKVKDAPANHKQLVVPIDLVAAAKSGLK